MVGVFDTQAMYRWQQSDKPFGSGIADDPVLSSRYHQHRRMNSLYEPWLLEGFDRFERGGQPSIRFNIFFHEFGAPPKNNHGTPKALPLARPVAVSQSNSIAGLKKSERYITHAH